MLVLDTQIDSLFIQFLERKNSEVKFARVDADVTKNLLAQDSSPGLIDGEDGKARDERMVTIFKKSLSNEEFEVCVEGISSSDGTVLRAGPSFSGDDKNFWQRHTFAWKCSVFDGKQFQPCCSECSGLGFKEKDGKC